MMHSHVMGIGEVARRSGLPVSTLRYYESRGLIKSVGRHGLRRVFDPVVIDQLAFISFGRMAGFSLQDLSEMATTNQHFTVDRMKISEKADDLDRIIDELAALRSCLRHVAACSAEDHFACPNFRKLLRSAGRRGTPVNRPKRVDHNLSKFGRP